MLTRGKRMTNEEKFIEVFGVKPDTNTCPCYCKTQDGVKCRGYEPYCMHGKWWILKYKGDDIK